MAGKKIVVGLLGALLLLVAFVVWVGITGGSTHVPGAAPGVGFMRDDAGASGAPVDAAR